MRRRSTPIPPWEESSAKASGEGISAENTAPARVTFESSTIRGFDFMEDKPLGDQNRPDSGDSAGACNIPLNAPAAGTLNGPNRQGKRVRSLFDLLQELSVPPDLDSSTSARSGVRTAHGVTSSPEHNSVNHVNGIPSLPNAPSDHSPAGARASHNRERERSEADACADGPEVDEGAAGARGVRGSTTTLSLRPTFVPVKGGSGSVSFSRTRRVTFVSSGPSRSDKESLPLKVSPSHTTSNLQNRRRVPPVSGDGNNGSGSRSAAGVESSDIRGRTNGKWTLRRVAADGFDEQESPRAAKRPSKRATRSRSGSAAAAASNCILEAIESVQNERRLEKRRSQEGADGMENNTVDGTEGIEKTCVGGDAGDGRAEIRWAGSAGSRGQFMTGAGDHAHQDMMKDKPAADSARWVNEDYGLPRYSGRWMTQEPDTNRSWMPQPDISAADGHAIATRSGAQHGQRISQFEAISHAITPEVTKPSPKRAQESDIASSPCDGRWMPQSDYVKREPRRSADAARADMDGRLWMGETGKSIAAVQTTPSLRKWPEGRSKEYCRKDGSAEEGTPCFRQNEAPGQGDENRCEDPETEDFDTNHEGSEGVAAMSGTERKQLAKVRGLCRMKGTILALVEWNVVDSTGESFSEVGFMLSSCLKRDWPEHYITYLEAKLVFQSEEACLTASGKRPTATGEGGELVVWKPGDS